MAAEHRRRRIEWPTLGLLLGCYALWAAGTTVLAGLWLPLGILAVALAVTLHSSLSHEALHGHPFGNRHLDAAAIFPALSLMVPYMRFRDTHLAHHHDPILTDPYDDPESNFLDPVRWARLSPLARALLQANNTLAGRLLLGPVIGQVAFMAGDLRAMRAGQSRVALAWLWHLPAVGLVALWMVHVAAMPLWAFALASYAGLSLLKIRTFLEHRAHHLPRARTAIIEDRGPLALLFLNNNLHVVHHMHPRAPWYALPRLYRQRRAHYLARNEGYRYASYAEVFRRYLWQRKDPVPHPLWPQAAPVRPARIPLPERPGPGQPGPRSPI